MTSKRKTRRPDSGAKSQGSVVVAVSAILQAAARYAEAAPPTTPPLPTPCAPCNLINPSKTLPFVQSGTAGASRAGNSLQINQTSNAAILNWQDFNIANGYSVNFKQPSATSATLNRIWSGTPSTIAGKLTANGQVYLVNQNGIVFANGAQVNVGGLVASTLDVADSTFLNGLLSGNSSTISPGQVSVLPPIFQDTSGNAKGVSVAAGATLTAADGGRIMLLGTTVTNQGSIATPDGQTILGAGNTVYLASTTDPAMRGLLIAVDGQQVAANSTVTNQGQISAARGNVTMAGLVVNQAGTISATTSVNANGSIYLVAGNAANASTGDTLPFYNDGALTESQGRMLPNQGGTLTLAPGSVTQVRADSTDTGTITDSQSFSRSQINLVGQTVSLQGNATVVAPAGQVDVVASGNPFRYVQNVDTNQIQPDDTGRIYLDSGSDIDVSGLTDVAVSASRNLIPIQLDANALQDDPLLRDSFLHGATVTVDLGRGTPLLNEATLNAYAATIGRGIDEKLTAGGTINLKSGGDIITRAGSTQNVSGGSVAYQQSAGADTKLLGVDGKVYDLSIAPNNIQYAGFADSYSYTDTRWGVTSRWSQKGGLIPSYVDGASAGTINVQAPQAYLLGSMEAATAPGLFQRSASTLPTGGTFILGNSGALPSSAAGALVNYDAPSVSLVNVVEDNLGAFTPTGTAASVLPADDTGITALSLPALGAAGFNNIGIYSNGTITVTPGSNVSLPGNGSLTLRAGSVAIDGVIRAPGSSVNVSTAINLAQDNLTGPPVADNNIVLGPGAIIDVSGTWVNDSPLVTALPGTAPTLFNGGKVSLQTVAEPAGTNIPHNDIILGQNSLIDVSGGGWVSSANNLTAGAAGSIGLAVGPVLGGAPATGGVQLGGTLRGESLTSGGSLSVTSAWASIAGDVSGQQGQLSLTPDFFTQNGFSKYSITGINGLTIGSGSPAVKTTISPLQRNLVFTQNMLLQPTGADLSDFTTLQTLPEYQRGAASVSFASTASSQAVPGLGNVTLNSGASIVTDPGASVTLSARENLTISGVIDAPAGTINLQVAPGTIATNSGADIDGYVPSQQLLITSGAQLLARGYDAIYTDGNPLGYRLGQVLSGGTITIAANKGSVVAQSGSVMDVSGASGVVDVVNTKGVTPTTVAGAAGSIDVEARENLVLNSTLKAAAAPVAGAAGGNLTVGLDLFDLNSTTQYDDPSNNNGPHYPTGDRTLTLTSATQLSNSLPVDQNGNALDGVGTVSVGTIAAGGFDNVTLRSADVVRFDGTVALNAKSSITLDALELTATPGTRASIGAAYVALGDSQYFPTGTGESGRSYAPVAGNALLVVSADLIDIRGNSALDGFQTATFNSKGDIRFTYATNSIGQTDFTGSLASAANLTFVAAQLYPTTETQFTINPMRAAAGGAAPVDPTQAASYDYTPGSVTIVSNVASALANVPLSALGSLTINGPSIDQSGVLRAPFGQLALNGIGPQSVVTLHPGSLTSVSADGQTIPYGSTQNATQWTYATDNSTQSISLVDSLPTKAVSLNGNQVSIDSNAKVDLTGSGDLYAYEFVAGTGGSKDVLASGGSYSYAILPSLGSKYAPIDYQYGAGSNIAVGKEIYLQGVPGIANGYYALLPARYALLPGAYGLRLVTGSSDIVAGSAVKQPDGSYMAAGRFAVAGTNTIDSRTSTFDIVPGSVIRTQSQYDDSFANSFFYSAAVTAKSDAVNLPADAGQLQLSSSGSMQLDGSILFAPGQFVSGRDASGNNIIQQGSGGIASIQAPQIEVVEPDALPDGSLQVSASSLNQLGAATLILGGSASAGPNGENLTVVASTVKLANTAADPLKGLEIILAATQQVELSSGSSIMSTGAASSSATALNVQGDGALLRVSSGQQETVLRTTVPAGALGLLSIDSGATVNATSLALDAAGNTQVDSGAVITARAVEASSSRISIGAVPTGTPGLNVTAQLLGNFTGLTDLELHSDSSIDLYGAVQLGALDASGKPILQTVTLDAGGLAGYGSDAKTIQAGAITLSNVGKTQSPPAVNNSPDGTGALTLSTLPTGKSGSGQLNLGVGAKDIEGFGSVTLAAAGDIRGLQGTGSLSLTNAGLLNLQSARISMDAGAEQDIANLTGAVSIAATTRAGTAPAAGLGGKLTISGTAAAGQSAVAQNGVIDMPAGVVILQAHGGGDLTLGGGSQVIATGAAQPFADTYATAPGGTVQLGSDLGNVTLASGALVDVSGVTAADGKTSSDAGSLTVLVPMGQFNQNGTLKGGAAPGQNQGNFTLDTAGNADHGTPFDVSALNLSAAGFAGSVAVRDRGDTSVLVSGNVRASNFELSADQGNIAIAGTIDTSGTSANPGGGAISLWADGGLSLASSAVLNSSALKPVSGVSARAGDITLGSTNGMIYLASGSPINIKGASGSDNLGINPDGTLLLRAAYNSANGTVNVAPIGATIVSSQFGGNPPTVIVEGVQSYSASSIGTGGDLSNTTLATDIQGFAANTATIASGLTPTNAGFAVQVRPGIDIASSGDLTVNSTLDLNAMATSSDNGVPIDLTLRAAGNLLINGSISDGFVKTASASPAAWTLATGQSGNLTLAAGADLGAVNPLSTQQGSGNFILTPGNLVRTGTGNISIAAGNDICLGCNTDGTVSTLTTAQASVIYTAGQQSANGPMYFTVPRITAPDTAAAYPVGGGNVDIRAGNDIVSATTTNLISSWLWRQGSTVAGQQKNTSWWVEFSRFQEGVGAFGGGTVSVQAGGDITDLSVVVPTTGRVGSASATDNTLLATNLVVDGGGNLAVRAGGNIDSGLFEDDLGKATLSAGGAIQADPSWGIAPLLSLADTAFAVNARTDVTLAGVYNSTAVSEAKVNSALSKPPQSSYFYTYDAASALAVTSVGGDVALTNDIGSVLGAAKSGTLLDTGYIQNALYPPTLNVTALSGNIGLSTINQTQLFPSADGNVNLLAEGNVTVPQTLQMLQVDPALFNTVLNPTTAHNFDPSVVPVSLPITPLHQADTQPARIVAATGDIDGSLNGISIPKQAELVAGGNIKDVTYTGENLNPSDVTLFQAAGNILYTPALNSLNQLGSNTTGIQVGGPGYVELLAGSGINLANSKGVITSGNLNDVRLPSGGATLITAAGLGTNVDGTLRAPAYDAFISTYLEPDSHGDPSQYAGQLLSYMQKLYPDQTGSSQTQALTDFLALPRTLQLPFVSQVLSAELNATGLAHNTPGSTYDRGYDAIATLFPTKDANGNLLAYSGDINMFYSQLKTEQGGDINLLVPGGSVVVGVPNPDPNLAASKQDTSFNPPLSADANLGLLVLGSGGVHGFADGDFDVNQSRILTLQGGDIILWSSNGNIDAGKGARTAQGAPPPVIQTDIHGNVFVNPVGAVTGSGIGQLLTIPGITAGQVDLVAPRGAVNAGEAGIRAVNLNIAALQVLNVGNIKVSGTATGLPVSDSGAFAGALSGANALGDAGKNVAEQLAQNLAGSSFQQLTDELKPTFIVVKMFCLGVQCDTQ